MEKASGRGARTGELKNPVQGAPHKPEDVLESQEAGNPLSEHAYVDPHSANT